MIETLIQLLVVLVIVGVVFYALWWFLNTMGLPEPFGKIAQVLIALVALLVVVYYVLLPLLRAVKPGAG